MKKSKRACFFVVFFHHINLLMQNRKSSVSIPVSVLQATDSQDVGVAADLAQLEFLAGRSMVCRGNCVLMVDGWFTRVGIPPARWGPHQNKYHGGAGGCRTLPRPCPPPKKPKIPVHLQRFVARLW